MLFKRRPLLQELYASLVRRCVKKVLYLPAHIGNRFFHAKLRGGGLGIPNFRSKIPDILVNRLANLSIADPIIAALIRIDGPAANFHRKVRRLSTIDHSDPYWKVEICVHPNSAGLEEAHHDRASRNWLLHPPRAWPGKDLVKAVELRTNTIPVKGIPSNPPELGKCRAGCPRTRVRFPRAPGMPGHILLTDKTAQRNRK